MAIDADTLARAQAGDREARREIVGEYAERVMEIVGDAAVAEAVLVAVVADLPKYRLGVERLGGWIETRARKRSPDPSTSTSTSTSTSEMIERVVDAPAPAESEPPKVKLGIVAAVVAGAAVLAVVLAIVRTPAPDGGPRTGAVTATARTQIRIARGTAVVEPGASLTWTDGAIDQRAGTIYYRIDREVAITTPHGTIRTGHASGRIAVGAGSTVVTIDEGGAVVGSTAVSAGGRAELP